MVAIGVAMALLGFWSLWLRWRGRLYEQRLAHLAAVAMGPSGFIAVLAGWITTEVGRQPYSVYGLLTTADSASPLDAPAVATSLAAFVLVYIVIFGAGVFYLLRLMAKPPIVDEEEVGVGQPTRVANVAPAAAAAHERSIEGAVP